MASGEAFDEEDEDASQPPDNDNPHNDPLNLIIENIMATWKLSLYQKFSAFEFSFALLKTRLSRQLLQKFEKNNSGFGARSPKKTVD